MKLHHRDLSKFKHTHTYTHTHISLSLSLTHTRTYTHTHTHTHMHTLSHTHRYISLHPTPVSLQLKFQTVHTYVLEEPAPSIPVFEVLQQRIFTGFRMPVFSRVPFNKRQDIDPEETIPLVVNETCTHVNAVNLRCSNEAPFREKGATARSIDAQAKPRIRQSHVSVTEPSEADRSSMFLAIVCSVHMLSLPKFCSFARDLSRV